MYKVNKKGGKKMKAKTFFMDKVAMCMNALAMLLVRQTANSACIWVAHQPEFPSEANRFKKQ